MCSLPAVPVNGFPMRFNLLCLCLVLSGFVTVHPTGWTAEPPDRIQGNWLGEWTGKGGMGGKNTAQIRGLGQGEYQATFTAYDSGEQDQGVFTFAINGASVGEDKVVFTQEIDLGLLGNFRFVATDEQGQLTGKYSNGTIYEGELELKRIEQQVESVGAKPLPGAIVLFDGTSLKHWKVVGESGGDWQIQKGVLVAPEAKSPSKPVTSGHLASQAQFRDAQLHLEFRVPYRPELRGGERGASGVYLWGQYELQIVDSFGVPRPKDVDDKFTDDEAVGALFQQQPPLAVPALPPGEWQAFDLTLTAPKLDATGKVIQPAELTAVLNGTLIHDRLPLREPTPDAPVAADSTPAGLILQNTGQPVEFRNIWYVPLDVATTR